MKKLSLTAKLSATYAVLIAGTLVVGALGVWHMLSAKNALNEAATSLAPRAFLAGDIYEIVLQFTISEKNYLIEKDAEGRKKFERDIDAHIQNFAKAMVEARAYFGADAPDVLQMEAAFANFTAVSAKLRQAHAEGRTADAFSISRGERRDVRLSIEKLIGTLTATSREKMTKTASDMSAEVADTVVVIGVVSAIAILVGTLSAFFVLRNMSRSIGSVIQRLGANSSQLTASATKIAVSAEDLARSTDDQAASVEETASAIDELTAMIKRNTDGAHLGDQRSQQAATSANRGKQAVDNVIRVMGEIDVANGNIMAQVEASNREISDITRVIAEIGSKTAVINDIVFQTKLLSFNASVEAARAGEAGKGFAVVAEEVGKLAQMSGQAAKEISAMLDSGIKRTESIVADSQRRITGLIAAGKSKVDDGTRVARDCGTVLEEIVVSAGGVREVVGEIVTAGNEQAKGVSEISQAMSRLDKSTQRNSGVSTETAGAAELLAQQAKELRDAVHVLTAAVYGSVDGVVEVAAEGALAPVVSIEDAARESEAAKTDTAA